MINPVDEDPQKYFNYSITGEILAYEKDNDRKAKITIDSFNLNNYALLEQRKLVASQVIAMHNQFSVEELIGFIGKFESFVRSVYADLKKIERG